LTLLCCAACALRSFESASAHLLPCSLPVSLPSSTAPPAPLRLFQALPLPISAAGAAAAEPRGKPLHPKRVAAPLEDSAAFVGGAVWALDWCPSRADDDDAEDDEESEEEEGDEFLLLGTHAGGAPPSVLGRAASGPGALQLWRVPPPRQPAAAPAAKKARKGAGSSAAAAVEAAPTPAQAPSLALLLSHGGGAAWDVKWRPPAGAPPTSARLGLAAVALADGTVAVVAIPHPDALPADEADAASSAADAASRVPALSLRPAWRGGAGAGAGRGGRLPWTLSWHPQAPHARLLAGCTDGRCVVWDMSGLHAHASGSLPPLAPPLQTLLCDAPLAVRAVCWAPAEWGGRCASLAAATGDDGALSVWDTRGGAAGASAPIWRGRGAQSFLLSLAWLPSPRCFVGSSEHGRLLVSNGVLGHAAAATLSATERSRAGSLTQLRASGTGTAVWGMDAHAGAPSCAAAQKKHGHKSASQNAQNGALTRAPALPARIGARTRAPRNATQAWWPTAAPMAS
jgi:hypothetical protein